MENLQNTEQEAPDIHSEHVKEEFYKWFESRGLLSELRAYMRQLMVKALEESNKNGKSTCQRKAATSPKLQAINLLMVDYLFHEDYLFTVSVFASEAQLLDSLPQYSRYVMETVRERRRDPSSLPRFSAQETEDILDTLRLPPSTQEAQQASRLYLSGHESLFTCIVRSVASSHVHSFDHVVAEAGAEEEEPPASAETSHQLWSQQMQQLLLMAGVKLQHIQRMQHKWAQMMEEERVRVRQEVEAELEERLAELRQAEQQQLRERQSRVELRERGLASLAEQLTAVHDDINTRLSLMQIQNAELQEREEQQDRERLVLEERLVHLHELQEREERQERERLDFEERLEQELVRRSSALQVEKEQFTPGELLNNPTVPEVTKAQSTTREVSVQVESGETKGTEEAGAGVMMHTQTELPEAADHRHTQTEPPEAADHRHTQTEPPEAADHRHTQTEPPEAADHQQQTSLVTDHDPGLMLQLQLDREKINELQEENLELRAHALQQRRRIDELTNRAAGLASQLEDSRIAIEVLSGRDSAVVVAPPPHPAQPAPVFIAPTFGFNSPQRLGGGEESMFYPRPQQTTPRPDGRRRPSRFAFSQNPIPTSEESSPTEEIIRNARAQIQLLENESAALQGNYRDFQNRLFSTDSVMFPPIRTFPQSRLHGHIITSRRLHQPVPLGRTPYPLIRFNNFRPPVLQTEQQDEEHEDSSSDAAVFNRTSSIENMTSSRRMFTFRNLRQFERWKQFKKKFQRRDVLDSRRNINMHRYNTSSDDDDESDPRTAKNRIEKNNLKKPHESNSANVDTQHPSEHIIDNKLEENEVQASTSNNTNLKENKLEERKIQDSLTIIDATKEKVALSPEIKPATLVTSRPEEGRLKSEIKRSIQLIESVKSLLSNHNVVNPATSTNGSLAVESLPRDSENGSQNEAGKTDNSSVLTVQKVNPSIQKHDDDKVESAELRVTPSPAVSSVRERYHELTVEEVECGHSEEEPDPADLQENIPIPLTIPSLRLVSPGLNRASEEFFPSVVPNEVAHHENDVVTTSVTSGSDILRELNSSKSESSSSVMSAGVADDSKHSSDFWN